jgi:hypothetical protein
MHLTVNCIKGQSYYKQREKYHLKLHKMDIKIKELAMHAKTVCDPNVTLTKQNKCKKAIDHLTLTVMKKNELIQEYELFEKEWTDHDFEEDLTY